MTKEEFINSNYKYIVIEINGCHKNEPYNYYIIISKNNKCVCIHDNCFTYNFGSYYIEFLYSDYEDTWWWF